LWAALVLPPGPDHKPPSSDELAGVATWALQFTPKVATVDEAVVMDVEASTRLFGGKRALRDRIVHEAADLGIQAVAWAPTSLGALALARAGREDGVRRPLAELLDKLPLQTLEGPRSGFDKYVS
jgi:protein ImuB